MPFTPPRKSRPQRKQGAKPKIQTTEDWMALLWAARLGVSKGELQAAIAAVGSDYDAVVREPVKKHH